MHNFITHQNVKFMEKITTSHPGAKKHPAKLAPLLPEFETQIIRYSNIDNEIIEWEFQTPNRRRCMDRDSAIKHAIQILSHCGVETSSPYE